jgi:hypothetical protein
MSRVSLYLRVIFGEIARRALRAAVTMLPPPRVIYGREASDPYLSRWYVLGDREDYGSDFPLNVYVHRFHRSDDDGALHSHPWKWSVAIVLAGGYSEERRVGDRVVRREVLPLSINVIRGDDYHRVDLLEEDAWSIFIAGPRWDTWYFWDRFTCARLDWRAFIDWKRGKIATPVWTEDRRDPVPARAAAEARSA